MADPTDVLIIGAGASGGVVARHLAEAGYSVVCLEQGRWHDRAEYRGDKPDWELTARKDGIPHVRTDRKIETGIQQNLAAEFDDRSRRGIAEGHGLVQPVECRLHRCK